MNELDKLSVEHRAAENQFVIPLEEGQAVVRYQLDGAEITFLHTSVPPAYRRRGIAAKLVQAALEYARDEKLKVVPRCWYVADFIDDHPAFQALL